MNHDVFISYSSKDQKIVEALSHYLEERGIRCFVAYRDIPKGKVWATVITEAIENCQMMVVVFSKDFNISEQVDREIELCTEEKKPILTFRIQDEAFKGAKKYYLKNLNWIDAFPNPNECFQSLYGSIGKLLNIEIRQTNELHVHEDSNTNKKEVLITQIEQPKIIIREDEKIIETFGLVKDNMVLGDNGIVEVDCKSTNNLAESLVIRVDNADFEMILVKGGTFLMGSNEKINEQPIHKVRVDDYYMSKYLVTQHQWAVLTQAEYPYYWGSEEVEKELYLKWMSHKSFFKGKNRPVEQVSWNYCIRLIKRINQITLKNFRLPTEAEWEYAARGGIKSQAFIYSGSNCIDDVAEYEGNNNMETKPVGGKKPNSLGFYDMIGNVWEFCLDTFCPYSANDQINPIGSMGSKIVTRGGGWNTSERFCHITNRNCVEKSKENNNLGFRIVLVP